MKKLVFIFVVAFVMVGLSSCRRNYKVNYAHVAVDTLQHNDVDTVDESLNDHLYEIPETPRDVTAGHILKAANKEDAREAEKIFRGQE